jgi:predicted RNA-binding Zn ribbon-like protein
MTTARQHAPHPVDHAHVADLDACLDLINTVELDGPGGLPEDSLSTTDAAVAWLAGRSLAHEDALRSQASRDQAAWLGRVHGTRQALREVWEATVEGRSADAAAVRTLNEVLRHAARPELQPTLAGIAVGHRHEAADPTGEALARLAEPLVDAIAAGDTSRFRICANDACRWVFEDTSRGGRRRWCDMTSCGNRAKVRRFRSRRRAGDPDGDASTPAERVAD